MTEPAHITSMIQTCSAYPSQWEGTLEDGRYFYVRYRYGYLSVGIGATLNVAISKSFTDAEDYGEQLSDSLDGTLSETAMLDHVREVITR